MIVIDYCLDCGGETEHEPDVGFVCQECGYVVETGEFAESEIPTKEEGVVDEL